MHKEPVPLIAHVLDHLSVGGMENGLVNLINFIPEERYRHVILCLTGYDHEFYQRIRRARVPVIVLNKHEGQHIGAYLRLWKALLRLRPDIVHTRTWAAFEGQAYAALAGIPGRVHGEHGVAQYNSVGQQFRQETIRRAMRGLVGYYTAVNEELRRWLVNVIGVNTDRAVAIYNGVDTAIFHPNMASREAVGPSGFVDADAIVVGYVGRMLPVKNPLLLVRAFLELLSCSPDKHRLRLVMIGDGPLRGEALSLLGAHGALDKSWLPGERSDVAELMRRFDIFVQPSQSEGTSNTILEAMATALPVVATRVGGNPDLVAAGATGTLTEAGDVKCMCQALSEYVNAPSLRRAHGAAGRARAERKFSINAMVGGYLKVYDGVLRAGSYTRSAA